MTRTTGEAGPRAHRDARTDSATAIDRWAAPICALYGTMAFAWYCVWKWAMAERSGDPAIFENCLWNASHGHGLRTALEGWMPHLAVHFSPVMLAFVPLYSLFPTMHVVHLTVAVTTSLAGWMFYKLARRSLVATDAALVTLALLLHPTIVLQTFMEFHEQALGLLPLVLLLYGFRTGSRALTFAAALALLATREDNALLLLGLAAYAVLVTRQPGLGGALAALAIGWLVLYERLARDWLGGGALPSVFAGTYGLWGATPGDVLRSLFTRPADIMQHLVSPAPVQYLVRLLTPFAAVLGFGDPLVLVMLPQLFLILLADPASRMFEIRLHYSLVPVTLLYLGAVGTLARLRALGWRPRLGPVVIAPTRIAAVALLLASLATMPVWMGRAAGRLNPWRDEVRRVMAVVPDTASVTAPNYLLNQMARRRHLAFLWGDDIMTTEYVIVENADRIFFEGPSIEHTYSPELASRLEGAGYRIVFEEEGWHVWRRAEARTIAPR